MTLWIRALCLCLTLTAGCMSCGGVLAADDLAAREERAMQAALARVAPSVVRVETVGGLERVGELAIGTAPTTGLVVSADGLLVSSAFNFVQKPDSILVTLDDGSRHAAKLVATDHSRMLVLLKIDAPKPLTVPEFTPLDQMRVGQWSLAVGRTFEPREPNVSIGIVSALDRIWGKAIQTDAKISPNNYGGPLVDIAGRVLGVLVPMSPQGNTEVAGVEWYDSGIGFAVPLATVMRVLPRWKEGHDLNTGLMGISLKGADIYGEPALIAAARAGSPAYRAGFRAGDTIVEVAGQPVTRQAQLKHLLGPLYGGERVRIVALRGEERLDREVELAEKIEAYEFPFLGVLPQRMPTAQPAGPLIVRYVYPDSPAAAAGIRAGDKIHTVGGQAVDTAEARSQRMQSLSIGDKLPIEVERGNQRVLLSATLGRLPETLPGELPAARAPLADAPAAEGQPQTGIVEIKIPEFPNECTAYVPESYDGRFAYGVIVWLPALGGPKQDDLLELLKPLCRQHDFILLAPRPADSTKWQPTEAAWIRRTLDDVVKNYNVDRQRIVVHGHEGGGAMAYAFGLTNLDVVRAIAVADAPLPRLTRPPESDPVHPLAFYTTLATKAETTAATQAGIEQLRTLKFPVTVKEVGEQSRYLTPEELAEMVRWFDTLDRW